MDTIREINKRIKAIDKEINDLYDERKGLLKRRLELKHIQQVERPKIYFRLIKEKYVVANVRVANKVHSVYLGDKEIWGGMKWRENKKLKSEATKKIKIKLQGV